MDDASRHRDGDDFADAGEVEDLLGILADDALLDMLGQDDVDEEAVRLYCGDAAQDRLVDVLLAWRHDIDREPSGPPAELAAACAAVKVMPARRPRHRRIPLTACIAAAALVAVCLGVGLGARNATPGDPLWGVTQLLYSQHADSMQAAAQVRSILDASAADITAGRADDARTALRAAGDRLAQVRLEDGRSVLQSRHDDLLQQLTRAPTARAPDRSGPGNAAPTPNRPGALSPGRPGKPVDARPPKTVSGRTTAPAQARETPAAEAPGPAIAAPQGRDDGRPDPAQRRAGPPRGPDRPGESSRSAGGLDSARSDTGSTPTAPPPAPRPRGPGQDAGGGSTSTPGTEPDRRGSRGSAVERMLDATGGGNGDPEGRRGRDDRPAGPTTNDPTKDGPGANKSTTNRPTENGPARNRSAEGRPTADRPAENRPSTNRSPESGPTARESAPDRPDAKGPAADGPAGNGSASNGPAASGSDATTSAPRDTADRSSTRSLRPPASADGTDDASDIFRAGNRTSSQRADDMRRGADGQGPPGGNPAHR